MQPFLALASVTHTFIQLLSWFGWAVITLVILAVLTMVFLTIRQSLFVQQFITKILRTDSSQDQTTNSISSYTQYTTGSNSSAGKGYTPTQNSSKGPTDDAGVESISGANAVGEPGADTTDSTTPGQPYGNNTGGTGNTMGVHGAESSFDARKSDMTTPYDEESSEESVTVQEPDHDFTSDDAVTAGTSPPVEGGFGSQFAADQVTDSLTSVQSTDVFDSLMDSMSDFDDSTTDVSSISTTDNE